MDLKRFIVTFSICMLIAVGIQYWMGKNSGSKSETSSAVTSELNIDGSGEGVDVVVAAGQGSEMSGDSGAQSDAISVVAGDNASETVTIGGLGEDSPFKAEITFDTNSASVSSARINHYKYKVNDKEFGYPLLNSCKTPSGKAYDSFMVNSVKVEGIKSRINLSSGCWQLVEGSESNTLRFIASINKGGVPFIDVVKVFSYEPEKYELGMDIEIVNHSETPVKVEFLGLTGPAGVLREDPRSDRRNVFVGYYKNHNAFSTETIGAAKITDKGSEFVNTPDNKPMEWFAQSNKFFTAIMRPLPKGEAANADFIVNSVHARPAVITDGPEDKDGSGAVIAYTEIVPGTVEAGATSCCKYEIYLGPIDKDMFETSPYVELHYIETAKGQSCAACSFSWLNAIIYKLMQFCHMVTHNYGISIIFLVFLVRLLLHPITKKSQINMQKMSKLGPKMEELKAKYGNNQKEMQRQMGLMYKEQGFNPIMGCLPMLLQMPIWIALYTSVDSNIGLRHEGLFPAWIPWLNDLSAPDKLLRFSTLGFGGVDLPMLGHVDAFNLLPILLCIAMFFQSKASMAQNATASPEQAQQQKMMLFMMPVMMLMFFYNAPSGLNLYIMSSTFAGLVEQKRIKKHLQEQEEAEKVGVVNATGKVGNKIGSKKKKPKGPYKKF